MIKKTLAIVLFFQFNSVFGQNTLEQIIDKVPFYDSYYSPFSYFDQAGKKQGLLINDNTQVLKKLRLKPLDYSKYYITGKYEINNLLVLFLSEYWDTEDSHFAILLDKSLNVIDRLNETAYDNAEGFYGVRSYVDYNIITTTIHNIYNNPKYVRTQYSITNKGFKAIKNQVVIKTPSGIRVRKEATTNSTIVTSAPNSSVFNYLSRNYDIDSIIDNGTYLKNCWLKIALKDSLKQLGYVFGAFAKQHIELTTNDYKVVLDEISKEDFDIENIKKKNQPSVDKITHIKKIRTILKHQLVEEYNETYDYYVIKNILADNGKEIDQYLDECEITGYFPKHHYLLLECGHSSEYIINLKNGEDDINRIGNPDYYLPSPKNTFRLNGYYSGQSNVHFLEKNNKNAPPEYLFNISSLIPLDYIEKYFWRDDTTLFLKIEKIYYKIQLQKI